MSWKVGPLKYWAAVPLRNGLGLPGAYDDRSWPRYVRTTDIASPTELRGDVFASQPPEIAQAALLEPGDIVMTAAGSIGKSLLYRSTEAACFAGFLVRFRPAHGVDSRFISYWMQSTPYWDQVEVGAVRSTIDNFSASKFSDLRIAMPPSDEQLRIADFLDDQVARIDKTIEARSSQINLVDELFLGRIAEVLSGAAEAGERGARVPWLPPIPDTWGMAPVGALYRVQLGKMLNAERASGPSAKPYLRNANVHWFDISTDDLAEMSFEGSDVTRYRLAPGDLMICEGGAGVAEAGIWDGSVGECYYQKSLHRARPMSYLPAEWLMYWLRLAKHVGAFEAEGNLATIPHLTGEKLREWRIPVPARGYHGAEALDQDAASARTAKDLLSASIERMRELKQSLITAAVTGEFDVLAADGSRLPLSAR